MVTSGARLQTIRRPKFWWPLPTGACSRISGILRRRKARCKRPARFLCCMSSRWSVNLERLLSTDGLPKVANLAADYERAYGKPVPHVRGSRFRSILSIPVAAPRPISEKLYSVARRSNVCGCRRGHLISPMNRSARAQGVRGWQSRTQLWPLLTDRRRDVAIQPSLLCLLFASQR